LDRSGPGFIPKDSEWKECLELGLEAKYDLLEERQSAAIAKKNKPHKKNSEKTKNVPCTKQPPRLEVIPED